MLAALRMMEPDRQEGEVTQQDRTMQHERRCSPVPQTHAAKMEIHPSSPKQNGAQQIRRRRNPAAQNHAVKWRIQSSSRDSWRVKPRADRRRKELSRKYT